MSSSTDAAAEPPASPAPGPGDGTDAAPAHGRFPGWWVVAGCFVVLTTASGLGFYGLAVYLNAFSKEQGWPLSTISLATTVFFVVSGVTGLYVARLVARYDVRYIYLGPRETERYGRVNTNFDRYPGISQVDHFGNVRIYEVNQTVVGNASGS